MAEHAKQGLIISGLCILVALSGCDREAATEERTPTASTEIPMLESATPSPTADLATSMTSDDWSDVLQIADLGPRRDSEHGGFGLEIPEGFIPIYRPGTIILRQENGDVSLSAGGGYEPQPLSLETGLENFILAMSQGIGDLVTEAYQPVTLQGLEGLETEFQGMLEGDEVSGRLMYLQSSDLQFLIVMGFSWTEEWESSGIELYESMVQSIELFSPTPMESLCPISSDPTFGFTQENPIRVGQGDPLTGPSMQRDYLNLLRGPNGESVTYVRSGSLSTDDSIVDAYEITYGEPPVTAILYVDQYHDGQFRLPEGFTCSN